MLKQRTSTALVLAPLAIMAVIWLPTVAVALLSALMFGMGFDEWVQLAGFGSIKARVAAACVLALIFIMAYVYLDPVLHVSLIVLGVVWWLLSVLWLRRISFAAAPTLENALLKSFAGLLAAVPAWAALIWLHAHHRYGVWLLVALLIVWGADTGAYFAGSRFGRRKLAPTISPGKTWAGVYGALGTSAVVAAVAAWLLGLSAAAAVGLIILALLAVCISIVGDLFESLLKRHALVKDSGNLFPGHGGLMDRLDSVFALLPMFALGVWVLGL